MKCLIVDDDIIFRDLINHFCSKLQSISQVMIAESGFECINLLYTDHFDVIFLDYHLPDITGQQLLELIPKDTSVILITSNTDFGVESYNYDQIVDYLVKPIDFVRFTKSIIKVEKFKLNAIKSSSETIFFKTGNEFVKVDLTKIIYICSASNYAQIHFHDKKLLTLMTMKELEVKLPSYFQRIHRSTIVNIKKIDKISNSDIHIGNVELSISNTYINKLMEKIKLLA